MLDGVRAKLFPFMKQKSKNVDANVLLLASTYGSFTDLLNYFQQVAQ